MSKIEVVWFKDLNRWDVGYFLGNHNIKTNFALESLENILTPRKERIKQNEYDGITPIVAKIPFQTSHIEYRKEPKTKMDMYAIYKNDLLVSNINFHQGAVAFCNIDKAFASTHYQPYIVNSKIVINEYLLLIFKQKSFQEYVATKKIKGIKTESNFNFIKTLQIPLPPLEIQREIVGKIKNIQDKIKALQDEEKRLKEEIEAYIYITLGLERKQEKQKRKVFVVEFKNLDRWDVVYNQNNAICHSEGLCPEESNVLKKDVSPLAQHDTLHSTESNLSQNKTNLYPLVKLGEICETNIGLTYQPKNLSKNMTGVPVLRSNNIKDGKINYDDLIYVNNIQINKNKIAKKGDLLMCVRNGSANLVGKTAFIEEDGMSFGAFMAIIRSKYNKFIYHILQTDILRNTIFGSKANGINQISQSDIKNFQIPLPPLEIQKQIVEHIESKQKIIEDNKNKIKNLQSNIDKGLQELIFA